MLPVPRVLSWSSDSENGVGAEYILQEKSTGVRLGSVWKEWPKQSKFGLIARIAEMEDTLTQINFHKHGCIYFKDDLRSLAGETEPIVMEKGSESQTLDKYSIGPLTSSELWEGSRKEMRLERGPCKCTRLIRSMPVFTDEF